MEQRAGRRVSLATRPGRTCPPPSRRTAGTARCVPRPMKLTTKRRVARSASSVRDPRSTQTRTVGGSADTLQTAVVVRPRGVSSAATVVTIATPDGNDAITSKNDWRSIVTVPRLSPAPESADDRRALDLDQAARYGEARDPDDRLRGVLRASRHLVDRLRDHLVRGRLGRVDRPADDVVPADSRPRRARPPRCASP